MRYLLLLHRMLVAAHGSTLAGEYLLKPFDYQLTLGLFCHLHTESWQ
jgi:hypothetical protein